MWRLIPFLALLLGACASVYLGSGAPPAAGGRDLAGARQDAECSRRLWQQLGEPAAIRVECRGGVVYLRGVVSSAQSRQALVRFVGQQAGVERVEDRLVVR